MKPSRIFSVLDLALKANEMGHKFAPMFSGEAGIGKSEICQAWAKKQKELDPDFGFIDLRLAYYEGFDLVGLPKTVVKDGEEGTANMTPFFWPRKGRGLILIEEPNRARPEQMNTLMQLMTDHQIGEFKLPKGWIKAACVNEGEGYEVNDMDAALRDRFEIFEIEFSKEDFIKFAKSSDYDRNIINFVESNAFMYRKASEIKDKSSKYVANRTFSKLNAALKAGVSSDKELLFEVCTSILGENVGADFFNFMKSEDKPLTYKDFVSDFKDSIKELKNKCNAENNRSEYNDMVVRDILDNYKNTDTYIKIILSVLDIVPEDQARYYLDEFYKKHIPGMNHLEMKDFFEWVDKKYGNLHTKLNPKV